MQKLPNMGPVLTIKSRAFLLKVVKTKAQTTKDSFGSQRQIKEWNLTKKETGRINDYDTTNTNGTNGQVATQNLANLVK